MSFLERRKVVAFGKRASIFSGSFEYLIIASNGT